jgi:ABC-2 type transport system ATP-binding protein
MKEIAIDAEGLTKSFGGRTVVKDLTLNVPKGEIYGFLGPNGSGKTTTIRMLCGLLTPDSGRGTCLGYDIRTQRDEIKRYVGYMTQRFSLYADLSIRENLEFVDEPTSGVDPKARREFWEEIHRLAAEGITVLVSTHYMDAAERCHEIAYIAFGELLARGTAQEVRGQA